MVATTEKRGTEFLQQHEQATHASAPRSGHESGHGILVRGVNLKGAAAPAPVLLKMHDDDFPARFFADLASQDASVYPPGSAVPPPISHAEVAPPDEPLYQPVQRMLNVAMVQLSCESVSFPRVDPTRIVSAGLVVRRCVRQPRNGSTPAWNDPNTLQAWMKNPAGQCAWVTLNSQQTEDLDPDPTLRAATQIRALRDRCGAGHAQAQHGANGKHHTGLRSVAFYLRQAAPHGRLRSHPHCQQRDG